MWANNLFLLMFKISHIGAISQDKTTSIEIGQHSNVVMANSSDIIDSAIARLTYQKCQVEICAIRTVEAMGKITILSIRTSLYDTILATIDQVIKLSL